MQNIFCRNSFSKVNFATLTTLSIVLLLVLLGIVVLLTASQPIDSSLPQKQLLWILISILFGLIFFKLDLEKIRPLIPYFGLFSLILLVLVLIPGIGQKVNGAQRWISFGFINLQVSEIAKLGLLLTLSDYLSVFRLKIDSFYNGFLLPNIILFLFVGLIFLEPDYGTAFLCGLVGYILLFVSGVNIKFLLISSISAVGLFILAILNNQERLSRIISFLDVESHKLDSGYQLWQGIIAFGVGGINGVGIGSGRQQMSFLPEAHTDFIFAVIGEELGLFFTLGVVFLFLILFLVGINKLKDAPSLYQYLLVFGALLFIILQAIINIGVVTGCLPTKGMSLPFISYGGSNLVLMSILVSIILNALCHWENNKLVKMKEL